MLERTGGNASFLRASDVREFTTGQGDYTRASQGQTEPACDQLGELRMRRPCTDSGVSGALRSTTGGGAEQAGSSSPEKILRLLCDDIQSPFSG